jgi:hypothetical protein
MNSTSFALCATAIVAAFAPALASAHDAASGQDYSRFRQPNGASCCDGRDCRPVAYQLRPDGSVVMFPDGRAVVVERDRLNSRSSDDGQAHWCGIVIPGGSAMTFCAILPRQLTRLEIVPTLTVVAAGGVLPGTFICRGSGVPGPGASPRRPP